MSNGDDVARADLGKIAWNAWATDHPDQSVDFSGVEVKGVVETACGGLRQYGVTVALLAYLQSIASLLLLFLVGLGVRNRFRIGSSN
jgi:hypothetical protein